MTQFVGMYWCCGGSSLIVDIEKAVDYYTRKYGKVAEYCYIKEGKETAKLPEGVDGVKIRLKKSVLKGHLWIGCYEEERDGTRRL